VKKMSQRRKIVARRRLSELFAFAGTLVAIGSPVFAGPEGEQVMHGQASFSRVGPETTINVGTRSAIINYRGFDIPRGEIVRFIQPDASSRVLNRINSQMPSKIDGTLLANGHVYLVNPSGFVFGNNALINVGKFTAAAANMSDGDFLRGVDRFTDIKGGVVNQGTIQAVSGVTLVGRFISNSGVINGESAVMIASGSDVLIGEAGGHTYVRIDGKQIAAADAANAAGKSSASGALGLGAGDLYSLAISNAGTIKAKNVKIQSVQAGLVDVGGNINASNASGKGGRVEVLGDQISLRGAKIDASGSTGGGDVRIGGDFRGQGSLQTASTVHTDRKTTINVDAKVAGNGGTIVLWSNQKTTFGADLSARGGEQGGDGGLIETSSKNIFVFAGGKADTTAPKGKTGQFLLDPATLNIVPGTAGDGDQDANVTGTGLASGAADTAANTVSWGQIQAFASSTNVVLEATGLVTVEDMGGGVGTADTIDLTLSTGSLTLRSTGGNIAFQDTADTIRTAGGAITLDASAGSLSVGNLSTLGAGPAGGNITLNSGAGGATFGTLSAGTGTVTLRTLGTVNQTGAITANVLVLNGSGGVFNLASQPNQINTLDSSFGLGNTATDIQFRNTGSFAIGGTNGLNATGSVLLNADGGTVSQTQRISANELELRGVNATYALTQLNQVDSLSTDVAGVFDLTFVNDLTLNVNNQLTAALTVALTVPAAEKLNLAEEITANGVLLTTDEIVFLANGRLSGTGAGVTIRPATAGNTINLGAGAAGELNLDPGDLFGAIQGTTVLRLDTSGAINVTAGSNFTASNFSLLALRSGGGVNVNETLTGTGKTIDINLVGSDLNQANAIIAGLLRVSSEGTGAANVNLSGAVNQIGQFVADLSSVDAANAATVSLVNVNWQIGTGVGGTAGINVGTGAGRSVLLISGGTVTQANPIVANSLTLTGAAATYVLSNSGNTVSNLSTDVLGVTSLTFLNSENLTIDAATSASGAISLTTAVGKTLNINQSVSGSSVTVVADTLAIDDANGLLSGTNGVVIDTATAGRTINVGGAPVAGELNLEVADLTNRVTTTNSSLTLGSSLHTGAINIKNALDFSAASYNTVNFTGGATSIQAALTGATVSFALSGTSSLTQTAASIITADNLRLSGTGATVTLGEANKVQNLSANGTVTAITFANADDLTIDAATTASGAVSLSTAADRTLNINQSVTGSSVTLTADNLAIDDANGRILTTVSGAAGSVQIQTTTAGRTINIGGAAVAGELNLEVGDLTARVQTAGGQGRLKIGALGSTGTINVKDAFNYSAGTGVQYVIPEFSGGAMNFNAAVTGTGSGRGLLLRLNGGDVSQTAPITVDANGLSMELNASGATAINVNLNTQNNDVNRIFVQALGGGTGARRVRIRDDNGFAVFGASLGLGTGSLLAIQSDGVIDGSQAIQTGNLLLSGNGGTFNFTNANNAILNVASNITGTGSANLVIPGAFGTVNIGSIDGVNGLTVGTGGLTLRADGNVTQSQPISVGSLLLSGDGGTFVLNTVANSIQTIATSSGAGETLGNILLRINNNFTIGTVGGQTGLTSGGNIVLNLSGGNSVKQSANAGISADGLVILSSVPATWELNDSTNAFGLLSGQLANGTSAVIRNTGALEISSIFGVNGFTALSSDVALRVDTGSLTQTQAVRVGKLLLQGGATAQTFDLSTQANALGSFAAGMTDGSTLSVRGDNGFIVDTIQVNFSTGNVLQAGINLGTGSSTLTLQGNGGTITQTASISSNLLNLTGATTTHTLTANNNVGTLNVTDAAASFTDSDGLVVSGISAAGKAVTLKSTNLTQSGVITVGTLDVTGSGTVTLENVNNAIGTFAGENLGGILSLKNKGNLSLGKVSTTNSSAAIELLDAGATLTTLDAVNIQGVGSTLVLTADDMNLGTGTVHSGGDLTLQPKTLSRPIAINVANASALQIDQLELANLSTDTARVNIGAVAGSGTITLGTVNLSALPYNIEFRGGSISIPASSTINAAGKALTFAFTNGFTQDPTGSITALSLLLSGAGTTNFAGNNNIGILSGNITDGDLTFNNNGDLLVSALTVESNLEAPFTLNIQTASNLTISSNITNSSGGAVILRAGTDGSGRVTFTGNHLVRADNISLRAGLLNAAGSAGTANVDARTNAPRFRNAANTANPTGFTIAQDDAISNGAADQNRLPDPSVGGAGTEQFFNGSIASLGYTLNAVEGDVSMASGTKFLGANLSLASTLGRVAFQVDPAAATINVNGPARFSTNISTGTLTVTGDSVVDTSFITLTATSAETGAPTMSLGAIDGGGLIYTLAADELSLNGDITNTDIIVLRANSDNRPIQLGGIDPGNASLHISEAELLRLQNSVSQLGVSSSSIATRGVITLDNANLSTRNITTTFAGSSITSNSGTTFRTTSGTATLFISSTDITQGAGASLISEGFFFFDARGAATLANTGNDFRTTVAGVADGVITLVDANTLSVDVQGITSRNAGANFFNVNLTSGGGQPVAIGGTVTATDQTITLNSASSAQIDALLDAGAGTVALNGGATEGVLGQILTGSLTFNGGTYTLNAVGNDAASISGNGDIHYTDATGLSIGNISGTLETAAAATTVDGIVNVNTGTIRSTSLAIKNNLTGTGSLQFVPTLGATQDPGTIITTAALVLNGTGNYTLDQAANAIDSVFGTFNGSLTLRTGGALSVGRGAGEELNSTNNPVSIRSGGAMFIAQQLIAGNTIDLTVDADGLSDDALGRVEGTTLTLSGTGDFALDTPTNAVNTIQTAGTGVSGFLTYVDQDGLAIASVTSGGNLLIQSARGGAGGNLTFALGSTIRANNQTFVAGNGPAFDSSAIVDMLTNSPSFRNAAGTARPTRVNVTSDGTINDSNTAEAAQFLTVNGLDYRLTSLENFVLLDASTKFQDAILRTNTAGANITQFNNSFQLQSLEVTGLAQFTAGHTITATTGSGTAISFLGTVDLLGNAVAFVGDEIDFGTPGSTVNGGAGASLALRPFTSGLAVGVSNEDASNRLDITQPELLAINNLSGGVTIGETTGGGAVTIGAGNISTRSYALTIQGGSVSFVGTFRTPAAGRLTLRSTAGSVNDSSGTGGLISTDSLAILASGGDIRLDGGTSDFNLVAADAGTGRVQLNDNDNFLVNGLTIGTVGGTAGLTGTGGTTVTAGSTLAVNANISGGSTVNLSSGVNTLAGGAGDTTFGPGVTLSASQISLTAGGFFTGNSKIVDVRTNAPQFANADGISNPDAFTVNQDGSITDGITANASQFLGGSVSGLPYTLISKGGSIQLDTASKVANSNLTLRTIAGGQASNFNTAALTVNTLDVFGPAAMTTAQTLTVTNLATFNSTIDLGANAVSLLVGELDLLGAVSGTNSLAIAPNQFSTRVQLGNTDDSGFGGQLNLSNRDLTNLASLAAGLTLGRSDGGSEMIVVGAINHNGGALTLLNTGAGGVINITAPVTSTNNLTFDSGSNVLLAADVSGRDVTFSDAIELRGSAAIANAGAARTTQVNGAITSTSNTFGLTFNGAGGAVNVTGNVGSGVAPLGFLTVNGSTASFAAVNTTKAQTYNSTTSTTFGGDLTASDTTGGSITFNGPISAGTGRTITATDTFSQAAAGSLSFSGSLIVNAGTFSSLASSTGDATSSFTLNAQNGATIGGDIIAKNFVRLNSGLSGAGNLSFSAAGVDLQSDVLALTAGNQAGAGATPFVDALTNAPSLTSFDGLGMSQSFAIRQDAAVTDANLPNAAQFQAGSPEGLSGGYAITSDNGGITINTASKVNAPSLTLTLTSSDGITTVPLAVRKLILNGKVNVGGSDFVVENTLGGSIEINGDQDFGSGNVTITADEIDFAGNLSGTGNVTLQPSTLSQQTALGGLELDSRLDLTTAEIARLVDGFSSITIGRTNGSGPVTVVGATTFADNLTLRSNGAAGTIVVDAPLNVTGSGTTLSIANSGGGTTLNADLTSAGGAITIDDEATIAASLVKVTSNGGAIRFQQTVNALADGIQSLETNAGASTVVFVANVGTGGSRLNNLTSTAASTSARSINSAGDQTFNGILITTGPATLTADEILVTGETQLGGDLALNIRNFTTGRVISGTAASALSVTNTAGGINLFNADIGGAAEQQLTTFNVASIGTTRVRGNVRTTGLVNIANTTQLDADTAITSGSGGVTLASITGPRDLSINANAGATNLGTITGLGDGTGPALTTTSTGTTTFNGIGSLNSGLSIAGPAVLNAALNVTGGSASTFAGTTAINNTTFTTTPAVNFGNDAADALTVTGNSTVAATGTAARFFGLVDGTGSLTVNGSSIAFDRNIGSGTALASLSLNSAATTLQNATTSGTQTFNGTTTGLALNASSISNTGSLGATSATAAQLTSNGSMNVSGAATLGAGGLNSTGPTTINTLTTASGPVTINGTTNLGSLATAAGNVNITGATNVISSFNTTTGTINITGPTTIGGLLSSTSGNITITGDSTLASVTPGTGTTAITGKTSITGPLTMNGPVNINAGTSSATFGGLVNGLGALTVNGGSIAFNQNIGGTTPLASLSLNSAATTLRNATTSGTQTFNGTTSGLALNASSISNTGSLTATSAVASSLTSNGSLLVNGFATLGSGGLNSTGPTTVRGALNTTAGPVLINGTTSLGSVTTNSASINITGATTLNNDVSTGGGLIAITGPVTLGNTITIDGSNAGTGGAGITITGALDSDAASTARGLTVIGGSGDVTFTGGGLGQTNALASTVINGNRTFLPAVRTTGNQTYSSTKLLSGDLTSTGAGTIALTGTTTLTGNVAIATGNGTITSAGTIDGDTAGTRDLSFNAGTGLVDISSPIGATNPVNGIAFTGGTKRLNLVRSAGAQNHVGDTTFNANLESTGGSKISISGTPKLNTDLTLTTSGDIDVGGTLASVGTRKILTLNGANVTTYTAAIDATNPIRQLVSVGGGSTVISVSNLSLPERITISDLAVLTQDTTIQAPNVSLTGGLDGDGNATALTPRSATILADGTTGIIEIGGTSGRVVDGRSTLGRVLTGAIGGIDATTGLANTGPSQTRLGGSLTAQGPIIFTGPLNVTSDSTLRTTSTISRESAAKNGGSEWGDIFFRGRVNSADAASPSGLALLTNTSNNGSFDTLDRLKAETPRVKFNAPVGTGESDASNADDRPLKSLSVNAGGRGGSPLMSTVVISDGFNGFGELPRTLQPASNLELFVTDSLVMGQGEKILSFGNLRIRARGTGATPGQVTVGDVNIVGGTNASGQVAGTFRIAGEGGPAPIIRIQSRTGASIVSQTNTLVSDDGAEVVTASTSTFAQNPAIVGGQGVTSVASGSGGIASNPGALVNRSFTGGVNVKNFESLAIDGVTPDRQTLGFFDLPATGPVTANVASSLAGAIPQADTGQVRQTATLSAGVFDDLRDMGVAVRLLTSDETVEFLTGRSLYNDFPSSRTDQLSRGANPSPLVSSGDFQVAVNRLPTGPVEDALATYRSLAYSQTLDENGKLVQGKPRDAELQEAMATSWAEFRTQENTPEDQEPDAKAFGKWLCERGASGTSSPSELIAMDALQKLSSLFSQLEEIGLSPVEMSITRTAVFSKVRPREISVTQLQDAITGAGEMAKCSPPKQVASKGR
jgi:filamentous hemagglutinin family protein